MSTYGSHRDAMPLPAGRYVIRPPRPQSGASATKPRPRSARRADLQQGEFTPQITAHHLRQYRVPGIAGLRRHQADHRRAQLAGLDGARAEHESPYGRIVVDWQRAGPLLTLRLAIPPNTRARITLPALPGTLTEAGRGREGVLYGADLAQLELGPGEWELGCRLP
mgnify:CR=1 FL=1